MDKRKIEEWVAQMRSKDWNPVFDRLHLGAVRLLMGATLVSGVYTAYALYKWKQDIDFRQEVKIARMLYP